LLTARREGLEELLPAIAGSDQVTDLHCCWLAKSFSRMI
jgi:hypothetical protein